MSVLRRASRQLLVLGVAGLVAAVTMGSVGLAPVQSADPDHEFRLVAPGIRSDKVAPPPPAPALVPVSLALLSGSVPASAPIEARHTVLVSGAEFFDVPSHPSRIAWYDRFGGLGKGGNNTLFAAHINYVNYGAGPFVRLTRARVGDILTIVTTNGQELKYSVQSMSIVKVPVIDMNEVVYPPLPPNKERVTLISCGGTFVPNASGSGGQYDSRVIVVAERYVE